MDTKNFKFEEFKCPCCGTNKTQQVIINLAQKIRDVIGLPVHVNSGYRCQAHNEAVGGVNNSYHSQGLAADLSSTAGALTLFLAVHRLYILGQVPELGYCIHYPSRNFVHVDCGEKRKSGNIFEVRPK